MRMLAFERRWAQALLEAFAPPGGAGLAPEAGEVDYVGGFERMNDAFTARAALGLRAALWIGALAPLWMWGRPSRVTTMPLERRTRLVAEICEHRIFLVRELAFLLKTAASFALLGTPSVRARSNYDRGVTPVWEHGPEPKPRLPLIRDAQARSEVA
ncbi:MAG: hypothetical protein ACOCV4_00410 [Myxococcota bacterium]